MQLCNTRTVQVICICANLDTDILTSAIFGRAEVTCAALSLVATAIDNLCSRLSLRVFCSATSPSSSFLVFSRVPCLPNAKWSLLRQVSRSEVTSAFFALALVSCFSAVFLACRQGNVGETDKQHLMFGIEQECAWYR